MGDVVSEGEEGAAGDHFGEDGVLRKEAVVKGEHGQRCYKVGVFIDFICRCMIGLYNQIALLWSFTVIIFMKTRGKVNVDYLRRFEKFKLGSKSIKDILINRQEQNMLSHKNLQTIFSKFKNVVRCP